MANPLDKHRTLFLSSALRLNLSKFCIFRKSRLHISCTGQPRLDYINNPKHQFFIKTEVIAMVDLTTKTIQHLFNRQVQELTHRTIMSKEDTFDYQLSGGWIQ